jgi:hypothetical protein
MRSVLLPLLLLTACRSNPDPTRDPDALTPEAWTRAFAREAVLVADEIRIEGPQDLLLHVAVVQDAERVDYDTRTVSEGLLQELVVRPGVRGEVRAQLDSWSLAATRRLVILQRPGEVPVVVRAAGRALWAPTDGSDEQRSDRLEFRGTRGD